MKETFATQIHKVGPTPTAISSGTSTGFDRRLTKHVGVPESIEQDLRLCKNEYCLHNPKNLQPVDYTESDLKWKT